MSDAVPSERPGAEPPRTLAPSSIEELAEDVRTLGAKGLSALVCGGGTELPQGNVPQPTGVRLSTRTLAGIDLLDADEGVVHVAAGTPVAALRDAARAERLDVALDPPSHASTVGGALAAAALGPRTLGYGRARDQVLGLGVVLGSGEATRCGGRVVKNVTGYDLAKLYVGSLGTLCVIHHAWLRLRPLPESVRVVAAPLDVGAQVFQEALAAARLAGVRAAALVDGALVRELESGLPVTSRDGFLLVVELASDAPVVTQTANALASQHGAVVVDAGSMDRVGSLEGAANDVRFASVLRVRVTVRASRLAKAHAALRAGGASVVTHPGLGLLCARFPLAEGDGVAQVDRALAACREASRAGEGHAVLAAAPDFARRDRDVFGDAPPGLALMRRLKAEFDPRAVLNPGIFAGRI